MRRLWGMWSQYVLYCVLVTTAYLTCKQVTHGLTWHLIDATFGFSQPPVAARVLNFWPAGWGVFAIFGMFIGMVWSPDTSYFWGSFASLIAYLIFRYWRSDHRKRTTQALGNKARAIRARLVRTQRERRIPLPA